ncbi:hypothetical protein JW826_05170 [Candidatus Woesearchaeota archaeon]|nr:hypothetical protein [Candidatus Woesearchaeota archaeon]
MITEQVRIISALSQELDRELTINQLSKIIKKSYAFTNKHVHELAKQGILTQKAIGSAIVCRLNYANEQAIGLLTYNSINQKADRLKALPKSKGEEVESASRKLEGEHVQTAFLRDSKIVVVTRDQEVAKALKSKFQESKASQVQVITTDEFERQGRKLNLREVTIIHNHELFWRLIARIA